MVSQGAFPNFNELRGENGFGRLYVSKYDGIENGKYTHFYAFGGRSFSIFTTRGSLLYDSADSISQRIAFHSVNYFHCNDDITPQFDTQSAVSGSEPKGFFLIFEYEFFF
jgi:hypothetical protein